MVFFRDRDSDRQPISLILPHLYLGAESDVTQDCLTSQGISYVLSVSRCCPQPSFLPQSQYFRIPIDDSLRDELLPWIPEALQFIDGAVSQGSSVLVHCAAGISRSPALTVAYVMYHLGLDLDEAYRFVKERRPSISPNFNFLGQLQCFQGTLTQKSNAANQNARPADPSDSRPQRANGDAGERSASANQDTEVPVATGNRFVSKGVGGEMKRRSGCENPGRTTDNLNQENRKAPALTLNLKQEKQNSSELSLSDQIRTLTLNQREACSPSGAVNHTQNSVKKSQTKPMAKPTQLQIPSATASLSDKRKTLTLSLTPAGPQAQVHRSSTDGDLKSTSHPLGLTNNSKTVQKRETETSGSTKGRHKPPPPNVSSLHSGRPPKGTCRPRGEKALGSSTRAQRKEERENHLLPLPPHGCDYSAPDPDRESIGRNNRTNGETQQWCNSTSHHQEAPEWPCATAVEAVEGLDRKQHPLSPLNLTVNKLFNWGGRILMGALLGPRIRVGQPALPYQC